MPPTELRTELRDTPGAPSLRPQLGPRTDVMRFLNEVAERYPQAISLAAGRPAERFFDLECWMARLPDFVAGYARMRELTPDVARHRVAQYGATDGLINVLVAQQLARDEGIHCEPGQILITAGCQEALSLALAVICSEPQDVVLALDPCYTGIVGAATLHHIAVVPVTPEGPDTEGQGLAESKHSKHCAGEGLAQALNRAVAACYARGQRPRVLYVVPNFSNPTGLDISQEDRQALLQLCRAEGLTILEDNPYGMFRFEGEPIPSMFTLDQAEPTNAVGPAEGPAVFEGRPTNPGGCVLYCGTYSKTLCPGLRVGFIVLPPTLHGSAERSAALKSLLVQAKSYVTVNTSPVNQAIVGGTLQHEGGSLAALIAPALAHYRQNRDVMLDMLELTLGDLKPHVHWNQPKGGFFLTVSLPFEFGDDDLNSCAAEYGVVVLPMRYFSVEDGHRKQVRLAFSAVAPQEIREAIARLARFVRKHPGSQRRACETCSVAAELTVLP